MSAWPRAAGRYVPAWTVDLLVNRILGRALERVLDAAARIDVVFASLGVDRDAAVSGRCVLRTKPVVRQHASGQHQLEEGASIVPAGWHLIELSVRQCSTR